MFTILLIDPFDQTQPNGVFAKFFADTRQDADKSARRELDAWRDTGDRIAQYGDRYFVEDRATGDAVCDFYAVVCEIPAEDYPEAM